MVHRGCSAWGWARQERGQALLSPLRLGLSRCEAGGHRPHATTGQLELDRAERLEEVLEGHEARGRRMRGVVQQVQQSEQLREEGRESVGNYEARFSREPIKRSPSAPHCLTLSPLLLSCGATSSSTSSTPSASRQPGWSSRA